MPDHGEAKYRREGGDNNTGTAIFRHMNLFILSGLLVRFAFFFHFPEGVTFVNVRHNGKVIERRRRRG